MQKQKNADHSNKNILLYIIIPILILLLLPLSANKEIDLAKSLKEINDRISTNQTVIKLSNDGKHFYENWRVRSKRSIDDSHVLFKKISFGISEFGRYSKILFHAIFGESSFADAKNKD